MRLSSQEMADVHILRQDFAQARNLADVEPTPENVAALQEMWERRDRAIRQLVRDGDARIAELSGMFRCSKTVVRAAIAGGQQQ